MYPRVRSACGRAWHGWRPSVVPCPRHLAIEPVPRWFGWHDGADTDSVLGPEGAILATNWQLLSIDAALSSRRYNQEAYVDTPNLAPASWVPLLSFQHVADELAADTASDVPPLRLVGEGYDRPPLFPSLSSFVSAILRLFDQGSAVPDARGAVSADLDSVTDLEMRLLNHF